VRKRLLSLAVAPVLLLAGPAAAPAQEEQYVAPSLEAEQGSGEQALGPQTVPAPSAGPEAAPALAQQVAEQSQTDTEQSQTDTEQSQTEEEPQSPEEVPNQYCDPLAEEGCEQSGNDQQSGDGSTEAGAVAPATTVGGELASTGAPIGLFALVGSALLGAGAALRRLSRGTRAG
jgi:hypothetical protein